METLEQLWPVVVGAVITPLLQLAKRYILPDFPIGTYTIQLILAVLCAWGLSELVLDVALTAKEIIQFAALVSVGGTATHAVNKTRKKLKGQ